MNIENYITISIIIPLFNEEHNIQILNDRVQNLIIKLKNNKINSEVILVDDHSSDLTSKILQDLSNNYSNIKYIRLSKNSGSHIAIIAGLSVSQGDCASFLAGDLQDPPELIEEMIVKWKEGASVVWAVRENIEGVSFISNLISRFFYKLMNLSSSVKLPPTGADFALLDRNVVNSLIKSAGSNPSLGGLIAWLGYDQKEISYIKNLRYSGKSKWTLNKKINAFVDAFVGFSYVPMRLMSYFGFLMAFSGFLYSIFIFFLKIFNGRQVEGWASIMVAVLLIGGIQMIMIGVLGEYLWRNLEESRKRPLFFIEKSVGLEV